MAKHTNVGMWAFGVLLFLLAAAANTHDSHLQADTCACIFKPCFYTSCCAGLVCSGEPGSAYKQCYDTNPNESYIYDGKTCAPLFSFAGSGTQYQPYTTCCNPSAFIYQGACILECFLNTTNVPTSAPSSSVPTIKPSSASPTVIATNAPSHKPTTGSPTLAATLAPTTATLAPSSKSTSTLAPSSKSTSTPAPSSKSTATLAPSSKSTATPTQSKTPTPTVSTNGTCACIYKPCNSTPCCNGLVCQNIAGYAQCYDSNPNASYIYDGTVCAPLFSFAGAGTQYQPFTTCCDPFAYINTNNTCSLACQGVPKAANVPTRSPSPASPSTHSPSPASTSVAPTHSPSLKGTTVAPSVSSTDANLQKTASQGAVTSSTCMALTTFLVCAVLVAML